MRKSEWKLSRELSLYQTLPRSLALLITSYCRQLPVAKTELDSEKTENHKNLYLVEYNCIVILAPVTRQLHQVEQSKK
jgi:hypothetical protein